MMEKKAVIGLLADKWISDNSPKTILSITDGANPEETVIDSEIAQKQAEAQANLKGSVGGVQGIIAIQQAVAAGTSDLEASVALLKEIYGFDEATSRKMIGTPQLKPDTNII